MTASAAARARLKWGNRCRWLVLGAREEPALSVTGGTTAAGPGRTHNTSSWWFLITSYLKQFTRKLQASLLPPASPMMRSSASMVRRPVWEATLVRSLLGNLSYFHICICSLWSLLKLTVVHFPGWCASERLHLMSLIYNLQLLLCSLEDDQASWSPWRQDSRSRIRRDWPIIREPAFYSLERPALNAECCGAGLLSSASSASLLGKPTIFGSPVSSSCACCRALGAPVLAVALSFLSVSLDC